MHEQIKDIGKGMAAWRLEPGRAALKGVWDPSALRLLPQVAHEPTAIYDPSTLDPFIPSPLWSSAATGYQPHFAEGSSHRSKVFFSRFLLKVIAR